MSCRITIQDIRELRPCYDPACYLPEGWEGTIADILRVTACPPADRLWVAAQFLNARTARLFAVWCARQALSLVDSPHPCVTEAIETIETLVMTNDFDKTEPYAIAMRRKNERHVWRILENARANIQEIIKITRNETELHAYYAVAWTTCLNPKEAAKMAAAHAAIARGDLEEREDQLQYLLKLVQ